MSRSDSNRLTANSENTLWSFLVLYWSLTVPLPFTYHSMKLPAKHLLLSFKWMKRTDVCLLSVELKMYSTACWSVLRSFVLHTVKVWVWQNHYPSQAFTSSFCLSLSLTTNFLNSKTFILKCSALLRVCCPLTHPHAYTDESAHSYFSPHMYTHTRTHTHTHTHSHTNTCAARFPAYRTAENTQTHSHIPPSPLSLTQSWHAGGL